MNVNPFVVHPIGVKRAEHDEPAERLAQLPALTHSGTPSDDTCTPWRQPSASVRQFADDPQHHIHLENDVLLPQFSVPPG